MFLYITDLLSEESFDILRKELQKYQPDKENNEVAPGRLRTYVETNTLVQSVFSSPQMIDFFSHIIGKPLKSCPIPIEYRKYPIGSGMKWHRDVDLFNRQIECVYTVDNTSDSFTFHKDPSGRQWPTWTKPNSVVIVQADGVLHGVSPVTRGERSIIKFALCMV
jgi:hypothetical protein